LPVNGGTVKIQPCAGTVARLLPNRSLLDDLLAAPYAGKTSVPAGTAGFTFPARGGIARKQMRSRQQTRKGPTFATGSRWIPNTGEKPPGIRKKLIKPNPQKPLSITFLTETHDG